jgi:hypothetical protein
MCDNLCNSCGQPQCETKCCCEQPKYESSVCSESKDFKCVVLEKNNSENYIFPCLDFSTGDTLLDLLSKIEELKCALINQNFFDERVKTNASDSTADYLANKFISNDCISWTTENIAGNIKLKPVLDFACIFDKIKILPTFCPTVTACDTACIAPTNVLLDYDEVTNVCPVLSVNLTALINTTPPGVIVEWHRNNTHTSLIANPTAYIPLNTSNVYVFTKDIITGCYSLPLQVLVTKDPCTPLPNVILNCANAVTILSGVFEKTIVSNGVIRVPISVLSSTGNVSVAVTGGGFTNNGAFNQVVTVATTFLDIPVTYDGTGTIGNHLVTFTITGALNSPVFCNFPVAVVCKPCVLVSGDVAISDVTPFGFDVNIANLSNVPECVDTYDIIIRNVTTGLVVESASNQITQPYSFGAGISNTNYSVEVDKNCCCGNNSTIITRTQLTTTCISTTIVGTPVLPDATVGVPYNYSFQLAGTQPFSIRPGTIRPVWMTETIVGDTVILGGTPIFGATPKFTVILNFDNCDNTNPAGLAQEINIS